MSITYASIVPLIGGETIGFEQVVNKRPEYLMSYTPFYNNDLHLIKHYNDEVPYYNLDEHKKPLPYVDVVNAVCPCAGLSSLSQSSSSDSETNNWMKRSANYVLGTVKPQVMWGENAPRLATKMGRPVVEELRQIAKDHGYTFSLYKTKSMLHGMSQVRNRAFYFFWKGDKIPVFKYYREPHERIEDTILNSKRGNDDPMLVQVTDKKPTENPYYQFILSEIHGTMDHRQFFDHIEKTTSVLTYIEEHTTYDKVAKWMRSNGHDKTAVKCDYMFDKLASGRNIMRKTTEIPKDHIGAFVGHHPHSLTHPYQDRYLTIRECLTIMGLPDDFVLQGGIKNLNHICQNVPVHTAKDMGTNVVAHLRGELETVDSNFMIQDNHTQTISELERNTLDQFLTHR